MSLREAASQALEALDCDGESHRCGRCDDYVDRNERVRNALRAALAEAPKAEPVAWYHPSGEGYDSAFRDHRTVMACTGGDWSEWIPLYTHPPAREAESVVNQQLTTELSDEECDKAIRESGLWTLACAVPQNLALLRGLCRAAARGKR